MFFISWAILAMVAHVVFLLDPSGDPAADAETSRRANVVGPLVVAASALLGVIEYLLVKRILRR